MYCFCIITINGLLTFQLKEDKYNLLLQLNHLFSG